MLLTAIRTHGLRHADGFEATELGALVKLPAGPQGVAVADAVGLFAAAFDASAVDGLLRRLGVLAEGQGADTVVEGGLPVQVGWAHGASWAPLLEGAQRRVTVGLDISLDPPLFGELRELALRDPRLVAALAEAGHLRVKVGWLFTADRTVAAVSMLALSVGGVGFPVVGAERPAWVAGFMQTVARRLAWVELGRDRSSELLAASQAPEPELRARFARLCLATDQAPFGLGMLGLVRVGERVEPRFGAELISPRQFGRAGSDALALAYSALIERPDVLFVPGVDDESLAWLEGLTEGDAATLEQVVVVPGGAP